MSARVMGKTCVFLVAALSASVAGTASARPGDAAFDARYKEAQANRVSDEGARFDAGLAGAMDTPPVRAALSRCSTAFPGAREVHGYFTFVAVGAYQLELRPKGRFATCVEHALESRSGLPEPPRYPWVNQFAFAVAPTAPEQAPAATPAR